MLFLIDIHSTHPVRYLVHTIYITPHRGGLFLEGEIVRTSDLFTQVEALQMVCCQADDWGQCSRDTVTRTCSDLYHVKFAPEDDGLKNYVSSSKSNFSS